MRVLKCAQVLGAAVGLLLLGGTAMADSSSAASPTGNAQHQKGDYTRSQSSGEQSNQGSNVSKSDGLDHNTVDNPTTDSTSTSSDSSNNSSSSATPANNNGGSDSGSSNVGSAVGNVGNNGSGEDGASNSPGSTTTTSGVTQQTGLTGNSAPMQIQKVDSSVDSTPVPAGSATSSPTTIPVIQAAFHPSSDAEVVTTYHLALQPPIVSYRYAALSDFATYLPMHTPAPHAPVPPKTNGVLGEFSVVLESVLVPQAYGPLQATLGWVVFTLTLLTLVLMPISLFRYNYGWWLRRAGLVTAPRSDAPTSHVTPSYFATPLFMGYVKAQLRAHSPSLMV